MRNYLKIPSSRTFESSLGMNQTISMRDSDSSAASKILQSCSELESASNSRIKFKFIRKLIEILECKDIYDIICWNVNGTSFIIKNLRTFIEIVLPRFYKHNNMSNFIRQLNMYNFKKLRIHASPVDPPQLTYHNPLFIRDNYESISMIDRKAGKFRSSAAEKEDEANDSALQIENKSSSHLLQNNKRKDEQCYFDASSALCQSKSASTLKSKLNCLKVKHQDLQEQCSSINRQLQEKDAYVMKLEQILLFLSSQVSKLPEFNQLECVSKSNLMAIVNNKSQQSVRERLAPTNIQKSNLIWRKPLDDSACTLTNDLSTVIGKVIVKYKQHMSQSSIENAKFLADTSFKECSEPPTSQNFLEISELNPIFKMNLRSNQSSFKTTASKFNLFEDPISNPYMSFNDSKMCLNSFTTQKQNSFTKASLNDPYFDKDEG